MAEAAGEVGEGDTVVRDLAESELILRKPESLAA